jgi:hypothetical protein
LSRPQPGPLQPCIPTRRPGHEPARESPSGPRSPTPQCPGRTRLAPPPPTFFLGVRAVHAKGPAPIKCTEPHACAPCPPAQHRRRPREARAAAPPRADAMEPSSPPVRPRFASMGAPPEQIDAALSSARPVCTASATSRRRATAVAPSPPGDRAAGRPSFAPLQKPSPPTDLHRR